MLADVPIRRMSGGSVNNLGYVVESRPLHPLASPKTGMVAQHRAVLYDKIGPGTHDCHWCSEPVTWELPLGHPLRLEVDHLDGVRANNDATNLVPSCRICNTRRKHAGNPLDWQPTGVAPS